MFTIISNQPSSILSPRGQEFGDCLSKFFPESFFFETRKSWFSQHSKMSWRERVPGKRRGQPSLFPRSGKVYDCPSRSRLLAPELKFSCEKQVSQEYVISLCETAGRRHLRPHRCSIFLFFFLLCLFDFFVFLSSDLFLLLLDKNDRKEEKIFYFYQLF